MCVHLAVRLTDAFDGGWRGEGEGGGMSDEELQRREGGRGGGVQWYVYPCTHTQTDRHTHTHTCSYGAVQFTQT